MLLDPLEEQFYLPTATIELSNRLCWQIEVVGQQHQSFSRVGIFESNTSQRPRVAGPGAVKVERYGLIANQPAVAIDAMRVAALETELGLGADDKETAGELKAMQAFEVQIATIEQIEGARFGDQLIQDIDLGKARFADVQIRRDGATQIGQRMQPDSSLGLLRWTPRKQRKAQIDQRRVQCVDGFVEIHSEGLVDIQLARDGNESLRELSIDAPIARSVGIGQCVARDRVCSKTQVIELGALCSETSLDIAQTFAKGQLCEGHRPILVQAREALDLVLAVVQLHATSKSGKGKMLHQLRKNELAFVHRTPPLANS